MSQDLDQLFYFPVKTAQQPKKALNLFHHR